MKVAIDGFNLALEKGTGVATYGRNLSYCLRDLGHEVHPIYGKKASADQTGLMQEVTFFDDNADTSAELSKPPVRERIKRIGRGVGASLNPFAREAKEVTLSGAVVYDQFLPQLPHFERLWNAPHIYEHAHLRFRMYGRRTAVRLPAPIDIMHWTYPLPVKMPGAKNIYTLHDLVPLRLPYTTLDRKNLYFKLVRHLVNCADHIVTVSETSKADIISLLGVSEDKVTNTYQAATLPEEYLKTPIDILKDEVFGTFRLELKKYFLYYGAIEPKKNVGRVIEAYLASNLEIPLVIVGSCAWKSDRELKLLKSWANLGGNGPSNRKVIQLDYVTLQHLVNLIRGALALTFPSLYEGFGLPILEGMVCGTPVITSNIGAMREIAGDAGILVDPYNTREIKNAMITAALDADLRESSIARGKDVARRFSATSYKERVNEVYCRIMERGR